MSDSSIRPGYVRLENLREALRQKEAGERLVHVTLSVRHARTVLRILEDAGLVFP